MKMLKITVVEQRSSTLALTGDIDERSLINIGFTKKDIIKLRQIKALEEQLMYSREVISHLLHASSGPIVVTVSLAGTLRAERELLDGFDSTIAQFTAAQAIIDIRKTLYHPTSSIIFTGVVELSFIASKSIGHTDVADWVNISSKSVLYLENACATNLMLLGSDDLSNQLKKGYAAYAIEFLSMLGRLHNTLKDKLLWLESITNKHGL